MDTEVIIKAKNGDHNSFEEIVSQNYQLIHRYVACKIGNVNDRDDIIQQILLIMYTKIHALKQPESFKPWLVRIMSNCCNKWYINQAKKPITIDNIKLTSVLNKQQVRTQINKKDYDFFDIISSLSDKQKDIIIDFYYRELKVNEISFIRGLPEGTVKQRLHYARKSLKKKLEENNDK